MWLMPALAVAVILAAVPAAAEDVSKFWEDNCAGCHTIGGGASGGPDLKSVTTRRDREWLIRFVLDPEAFASDPEIARMMKEADGMTMSATPGLTRELAAELLTFIEQRSGAPQQAAAPAAAEPPVTAADVARGRDLFLGASPMAAAGPACIACHEVGALPGGHLGPDLTRVHERLGGRRGLLAWLGATPTPMMRAVYRPAPLTPDEARALTAFLGESATAEAPRPLRLRAFVIGGFGGAAAVLGLVGVVWARRFRGVRRPLVAATRAGAPVGARHAPGASAMRDTRDLGGQR